MRVLFLGLNYAPEQVGIAVYSAGLCEHLVAEGHEVHAVVGKPYYPEWSTHEAYRGGGIRKSTERQVEVVRVPLYVPSVPSGAKRLLHHASFAFFALWPMLSAAHTFKPDLVVTVAPSLIAAPVAWLAAKLARVPSWLHIQDFESEAAIATGLIDAKSFLGRFASRVVGAIFRRFERLSSISPEMCAKFAEYGVPAERVVEFRNWAALENVSPLTGPSPYRAEWAIETPHVALYSGNIANKQGIEIILEAAERLKLRADLTFVICGMGPNRPSLEVQAAGLRNIRFVDLQPLERLGDLLGLASVHLLPQKADAADLMLPSKLTNMLASGRPVVATAPPGSGLAREVAGSGIVVPPGDAGAFAYAIEALLDDEREWRRFAGNARARAEAAWNQKAIVAGFIERAEELSRLSRWRRSRERKVEGDI